MWARSFAVAAVMSAAIGCGDDGGKASSAERSSGQTTSSRSEPCPEGTKRLRVRDVLTPPATHELLEPGAKLKEIVRQWEEIFGGRALSTDTMVYVVKSEDTGTGVAVFNVDEKASVEQMLSGAAKAEAEGRPSEQLRIAGQPGIIARAPDGAYTAFGAVGPCAAVWLVADTKRLVQETARLLRSG